MLHKHAPAGSSSLRVLLIGLTITATSCPFTSPQPLAWLVAPRPLNGRPLASPLCGTFQGTLGEPASPKTSRIHASGSVARRKAKQYPQPRRSFADTTVLRAAPLWLQELEEIGMEMDDADNEALALRAAKVGDLTVAAQWMARLSRPAEQWRQSYHDVLEALLESLGISRTLAWLDIMSQAGVDADADTYAKLVTTIPASRADLEVLRSAISEAVQDGLKLSGNTLDALVIAAAKRGDLELASEWFWDATRLQGHHVPLDVFTALVAAATRYGDEASVAKWMDEAANHGVASGTVARKVLNDVAVAEAFRNMTHSAARAGNVAEAESWFRQMEASGETPDYGTLAAVVNAAARYGTKDERERWYAKAFQVGQDLSARTWSWFLGAAAREGDGIAELEKWFDRLIASGRPLHAKMLQLPLREFASQSNLEGCLRVVELMKAASLEPSAAMYTMLIDLAGKRGDSTALNHCVELALASGTQNPARLFATVIDAAAIGRDYENAKRWYNRSCAASIVPQARTFNAMIRVAAQSAGFEEAMQWYQIAEDSGALKPNNLTYTHLVVAAARERLSLGEEWYRRAVQSGAKVGIRSFHALMTAAAKQKNPEAAVSWLMEAELAGIECDVVMVAILIDAAAEVGDLESAEEWFRQAQKVGMVLDEAVYTTLIKAAARSGDLKAAEKWYYEVRSSIGKIDSYTLNAMLNIATKVNGTLPEGARIYNQALAAGTQPDVVTLSILVQAAARQGEPKVARHWLEEAVVQGIPSSVVLQKVLSSFSARDAFNIVIQEAAGCGNVEEASRWSLQATRAGMPPSEKAMSTLVIAAAREGNYTAALQWAEEAERANLKLSKGALKAVESSRAIGRIAP